MAYINNRDHYSAHTVTNTETGVTITQWDRVTVGKSANVWDVAEILWDGEVRLHRQTYGAVTYRRVSMDRLTVVTETEK